MIARHLMARKDSGLEVDMHPWSCALSIGLAGAVGGVVNAIMSDNGFALPRGIEGVWCPGAISTIVIGAFAAFASWAFYGSGAGINLADTATMAHLQLSALAGAFLVGIVGAKWITNETEKRLLTKSVGVAATKVMTKEKSEGIPFQSPIEVLKTVTDACSNC
jgi:hypothetical protein